MIGRLKDKKEIATGTLQVVFETDEQFTFKAGQYCFITLINPPYSDERGNKRHFSIVNSPNQKGIITFTTRLQDTGFKKALKELPLGSEVQLGPIAGQFTLPDDSTKPLVFIAGGIGITPFMSMLRYVKEESLPYKITLVFSNRDRGSTPYLEELSELAKTLTNFKLILTMTEDNSWQGEKRMIDASFIKDYFQGKEGSPHFQGINESSYCVVGPPPMVAALEKALDEAGVAKENIKIENFTGY